MIKFYDLYHTKLNQHPARHLMSHQLVYVSFQIFYIQFAM